MSGNISYQVTIPKVAPSKDTSVVEKIVSRMSVLPSQPDGTKWVVLRDSVALDQFIHTGYGSSYVAVIREEGRAPTLGTYTFDYGTGILTFHDEARASSTDIVLTGYRVKISNVPLGESVVQIAAFDRQPKTGTSSRAAKADHDHGSPPNPVPVHAGDRNVHHAINHDHSLENDEGRALRARTLVIPGKSSGEEGGELYLGSTTLKFLTNEVTPVEKTVKTVGDAVSATEHGDQGGSAASRHNYSVIDGTHDMTDHTNTGSVVNLDLNAAGVPGDSTGIAYKNHSHGVSASGTTPVETDATAGAAGSAAGASRGDHRHRANVTALTGDISDVGTSAAVGTSDKLVRADHRHRLQIPIEDEDVSEGSVITLNFQDPITVVVSGSQANISATIPSPFLSGALGSRPDPATVVDGTLYYSTDVGVTLMSNGTNWYPIANNKVFGDFFEDDFISAPTALWSTEGSGSGTTGSDSGSESIVRMATGTTTQSYASIGARDVTTGVTNHIPLNDDFLIMIRARSNITSGNGQAWVGLAADWPVKINPGVPNNAIILLRNSGGWAYYIQSGGSNSFNTAVSSGTTTGYVTFFIERSSGGVHFYRDNLKHTAGAAATDTTTLPSVGSMLLAHCKNTSSATNYTLDIDYIGLWNQR